MAFNLFDLAATISVKTNDFEKKLSDAQKKVHSLEGELKKLDKTAASSGTGLSKLGQQGGAAEAGISSLGAALPTLAGAATFAAAALGGTAAALYQLITTTAEATGKFKDLSQQVGFSVETLSTLEHAAKTSGGSIQTVVGALGIFEKNMEAAHEKGSAMSRVFKTLNIDINDHEKALREAITALAKMPEGARQTATALKLFGRSGKDVLAIVKETGGDVDALTAKLRRMGVLITTEAATAADLINDRIYEVGQQFAGVGRIVAEEFYPMTARSLNQISDLLTQNRGVIQGWVSEIMNAANGAYQLASAVAHLGGILTGLGNIPIPLILRMLGNVSGISGIFSGLASIGRSSAGPSGIFDPANRASAFSALAARATQSTGRLNFGGGGGGGGRGGGGGTDPGVSLLKQLQEQFKTLTERTELQRIQDKLLDDQYKKTTDTIKKRIMVAAIEIDIRKQQIADFNSLVKLVQQLGEQGEAGFTRARRAGGPLLSDLQKMVELSQQMAEGLIRPRTQGTRTRPRRFGEGSDLVDLGGGSFFGEGVGGNRERFVTTEQLAAREQMEEYRRRMREMANELTGAIDNAIRVGFESGIKAGFASLLQSLLDMINQIFLKRLAQGIGDILSGIGGDNSWWKTLLGFGISAAGSAFGSINLGGGSSFTPGGTGLTRPRIVGKALGGPVSSMTPYIVGERGPELFIPSGNGNIVPNGAGGVINNYITVYARDANSFQSRDTQNQIIRQMTRLQQKRMLTG